MEGTPNGNAAEDSNIGSSTRLKSSDEFVEPVAGRLVTANDFAKMSTKTLMSRKAELIERVALRTKFTNDYKKKVSRVARLLDAAKEPGQMECRKIVENKSKIQAQMQQNLRNKQAVFKGLKDAIEEQQEKVKSIEDQGGETRRQLEEVHKYLRQIHHYEQLMHINFWRKGIRFLEDFVLWFWTLFLSLVRK